MWSDERCSGSCSGFVSRSGEREVKVRSRLDNIFSKMKNGKTFNVLTLDGGGAKGVYTLGILQELEAAVNKPLCQFFDAIYGTSTGAIIAALLGIGATTEDALALYMKYVPTILKPLRASGRSTALARTADELFGERTFEDFQTFIGIVATNWTLERPLIFKSSIEAAHGLKATFVPGFGATISTAIQASCCASPFFEERTINLGVAGNVEARDGGFSANNPSLFAITDALKSFKHKAGDIRLLTLGVGHYPEKRRWWGFLTKTGFGHLLQKTLSVNANTTETLIRFLCDDIKHLRISERFEHPELATDFLECRKNKLEQLILRGRESFGKDEAKVRDLFDNYA